jgi:hypothetical protein
VIESLRRCLPGRTELSAECVRWPELQSISDCRHRTLTHLVHSGVEHVPIVVMLVSIAAGAGGCVVEHDAVFDS